MDVAALQRVISRGYATQTRADIWSRDGCQSAQFAQPALAHMNILGKEELLTGSPELQSSWRGLQIRREVVLRERGRYRVVIR